MKPARPPLEGKARELLWPDMMRRTQEGDSAAYSQLLTEITPVLRRVVANKWRNSQDVEDIVQEILLSVHAVRRTYDPNRPFMPWLMTIAYRRIADTARQRARRNANETTVEFMPETFPNDQTKTGQEQSDDRDAVREAMSVLPDGQREAIELLKLKCLSLHEASTISGKSIPSLKVSVHRAMKAMRAHLGRKS